jgi:hypothetical protein
MNEIKSKKTGLTQIVSDEELVLMGSILHRFTVTKLVLKPLIPSLKREIVPEIKKPKK